MKFILIVITLLFVSVSGIAQTNILEDKEYSMVVSESCKSFNDGGCLVTTYNILKFEKDSVSVKAYTNADCDITERNAFYNNSTPLGKYSYQMHKKKGSSTYFIRINGYSFGLLEVFPDYLIELNLNHTTNPDHIFNLIK